jgi:hypothetical protein
MKKNTVTLKLSGIVCLLFVIVVILKYIFPLAYQVYIKTQPYYVDVMNGTIDGLKPTATHAEIVAKFPDYTSIDEKETDYNNGGGVFFLNKGMFFYTYRDIIDIREDFIGNVSHNLMSKGTNQIPAILKKIPITSEENSYSQYNDNFRTTRVVKQTFEMDYGKLIIESTPSSVYGFEIHYSK